METPHAPAKLKARARYVRHYRDAASLVSREECLSPIRVRMEFAASVLTRLFKMEEPYGTRRPALLGIDVRRGHAVALDRTAAYRHLRCPRTRAQKLRTHRCYNLIYKKSRSYASWCRRIYAHSFPI